MPSPGSGAAYFFPWAMKTYKTPPEVRERALAYYYANRESCLARTRARAAALQEVRDPRFLASKRLSRTLYNRGLKQAQPPWVETESLRVFYVRAKELERDTGIPHHVDHIVPLRGKSVCGLHVPWNLQVLPAEDNLRKGNRIL